jgi:hypothetical protein
MMQAADFGNRDDHAEVRRLDSPSVGCVLVEREVSASTMIVREVRCQDAFEMPLAKNDDMVQALASHRADEPLGEGVLPGTVRRREDFLDPHAFTLGAESVRRRLGHGRRDRTGGVVREGVHDLLGSPVCGGVLGHVEVDDAPAMVSEHDENEEHAHTRSGHREEIEGDQVPDVIGQERPPGLGRRGGPLREQPGDGAFGYVDTELEKLTSP